MSTGVYVQDGPEALETLEQQCIIERVSVEPEDINETASLLGHSKRPFPKRVMLLVVIILLFTTSAISTNAAGMDVMYKFVCYFLEIDKSQCLRSDLAGEKVANFTGMGSMIRGSCSLVISTYLSALSDRLGRRPLFVCAMLLTSLAHISSWYIVFHMPNPTTYWWLMVPTVIDGLGGGVSLVSQLCVSYVSDMVPDASQRARLLAIIDGCFFASLATGPTLGSIIIRYFGIEKLYIAAFTGALIAAFLTIWLLQESLSAYHKRRNSTAKRDVSGTLSQLTFNHVQDPKMRRNARIMLVCALLGTDFAMSFVVVLMLYPKRMFGWTAVESGFLVSTMSTTRTLWFVLGFPFIYARLSKIWTVHGDRVDKIDVTMMRMGLVCSVTGYLALGWSKTPTQFFVSAVVDACSTIGMPIYKASLIKHVPQGQFGSFMAAFNLVCSIGTVFAPTMFLKLYSWAFRWRPYLPFEVVATLFIGLFIISFMVRPSNQ